MMDGLTLFGLVAVSAMLVTYSFERRSHWFVLGFAASCAVGSLYGFLQGAWPFGLVEAIWSLVALHRWWSGDEWSADRCRRDASRGPRRCVPKM